MSILFHLQTLRLKKGLGKDMKEKELRFDERLTNHDFGFTARQRLV